MVFRKSIQKNQLWYLLIFLFLSISGCVKRDIKEFTEEVGRRYHFNKPAVFTLGDINKDGLLEYFIFPAGQLSGTVVEGLIFEKGLLIQKREQKFKVLIEFTPREMRIPGNVSGNVEPYNYWHFRVLDSNNLLGLKINARTKEGKESDPDIFLWDKKLEQYVPMF